MSDLRICGVPEVVQFIHDYKINKILSCLSNYKVVDMAYGFSGSVIDTNPSHWRDPSNWLKLEMEDTVRTTDADAPTNEEVVKGITFGGNCIKSGSNLLVHCQLGISRSPAMAIGSLLVAGNNIQQAYDRVKNVRSRMDPNPLIISLIDSHLGLNGELSKFNDEHRANTRKDLKRAYTEMIEHYLCDSGTLGVIMESISALNKL